MVDDKYLQRQLYYRLFGVKGYQVFTAASGFDALDRIRGLRPDFVLADIDMRGMDGIKLYKILRSRPETAGIPVILMTGMPVPDSLVQAAADGLGASPIWIKGDFIGLLSRIDGLLAEPTSMRGVHVGRERYVLAKGDVSFDLIHRVVLVAGRAVPELSAKCFDVLLALFRHEGPMSQEDLQVDVWACECDLKTVQVAVYRLRKSLKGFPAIQIRTDTDTYELRIDSRPDPR